MTVTKDEPVYFELHGSRSFDYSGSGPWRVDAYLTTTDAKGKKKTVQLDPIVAATADAPGFVPPYYRAEPAWKPHPEVSGGFHHLAYGIWRAPNDEPFDPRLLEPPQTDDWPSGDPAALLKRKDELEKTDTQRAKQARYLAPLVAAPAGVPVLGIGRQVLYPTDTSAYVSPDGFAFVTAGLMSAARGGVYRHSGGGDIEAQPAFFDIGTLDDSSLADSTSAGLSVDVKFPPLKVSLEPGAVLHAHGGAEPDPGPERRRLPGRDLPTGQRAPVRADEPRGSQGRCRVPLPHPGGDREHLGSARHWDGDAHPGDVGPLVGGVGPVRHIREHRWRSGGEPGGGHSAARGHQRRRDT